METLRFRPLASTVPERAFRGSIDRSVIVGATQNFDLLAAVYAVTVE
jgi:uncharacterized DUF497 family protein